MKKKKTIGIEVKSPSKKCQDKHCPYHGNLKVHGRIFTGKVISKDTHKTVKIEWPRLFFLRKYERFEKRRSIVKAHNPDCISAEIGDKVKIAECRPISKTKKFVVVEKNETHTSKNT